ncbi:MAG: flavin reductase family protein [Pseudomonadota bacterium]
MKQEFLNAMAKAAQSVTVVTTDGPGGRRGVTVTAMCSVSVDAPSPTLLVCIHHLSPTCSAILENGVFCANLLGESQAHISDSFAGRSNAKGCDKFACAEWTERVTGAPVLVGALAAFDCRLNQHHRISTHHLFVGGIRSVETSSLNSPLVYHDRHYSRTEALEVR